MSKQTMREEAERLVREAMQRKGFAVQQGETRVEAVCGKCGGPNRLSVKETGRVKFTCRHCGHVQKTL